MEALLLMWPWAWYAEAFRSPSPRQTPFINPHRNVSNIIQLSCSMKSHHLPINNRAQPKSDAGSGGILITILQEPSFSLLFFCFLGNIHHCQQNESGKNIQLRPEGWIPHSLFWASFATVDLSFVTLRRWIESYRIALAPRLPPVAGGGPPLRLIKFSRKRRRESSCRWYLESG